MNKKYGYCRVASCAPETVAGNIAKNAAALAQMAKECAARGADIAVFPALALTGASCGDLFASDSFLDCALEEFAASFLPATASSSTLFFVGLPLRSGNKVYSCTVAAGQGRVVAVFPARRSSPGERVFGAMRPGESLDFNLGKAGRFTAVPRQKIRLNGDDRMLVSVYAGDNEDDFGAATILVRPSAGLASAGKLSRELGFAQALTSQYAAAMVCANAGLGESTADGVYGGELSIVEAGTVLARSVSLPEGEDRVQIADVDVSALCWRRRRAGIDSASAVGATVVDYDSSVKDDEQLLRPVSSRPFLPDGQESREKYCDEVVLLQSAALAARFRRTGAKSAVVGISGGLDSAMALVACAEAFDRLGMPRSGICAITMPGFGTTGRTYGNSVNLCEGLGVTLKEIPIAEACRQHFKDIGHPETQHDVVFENVQARERTQILMDVANQCGGLVIGTGDMSENALGWCTYNGDHMSMYAVNAGLPKTVIRAVVQRYAEQSANGKVKDALLDILATPVSPELLPAAADGNIAQKTENTLGPYEVHDFIIFEFLSNGSGREKILFLLKKAFGDEFGANELENWLNLFFRRFFSQQFKRACQPDAPDVLGLSLCARNAWVMPSDVSGSVFGN